MRGRFLERWRRPLISAVFKPKIDWFWIWPRIRIPKYRAQVIKLADRPWPPNFDGIDYWYGPTHEAFH